MPKTPKLDALEKIQSAIRLSFPVLNITTFELGRAAELFETLAHEAKKGFVEMPFKSLPTIKTLDGFFTNDTVKQQKPRNGLVVFDPFFFDRMKASNELVPALKSSLIYLENKGISYIIAGNDIFNDEYVYHVEMPAMRNDDVIDLLRTCERNVKKRLVFDDAERQMIANHAKGLSHTQMKNVFTFSAFLKFTGQPYLSEILSEKAHMLRDVGLDVLQPVDLADVGGLDNLKEFLTIRKSGWDKNLPVKGVLLAGVPGGGKSLTAKAAAHVLGTTLVRLDMGRFYNKFLGETERQFNRALKTVEEIAPIVVLIDEIEKFFSFGESEHEVSKRLLGTFLYWLQERKEKIFIVATANRAHSLPPELMRAGRWDKAFFIGLPTAEERRKIFQIHLAKHSDKSAGFDLPALIAQTDAYTGAEIEQSIIDALYIANHRERPLDTEILTEAISLITPTSETCKDDLDRILALKNQGFYPANRQPAVDEEAGPVRKVAV